MEIETQENLFASQDDPVEEFTQEQTEKIEEFPQTQEPEEIEEFTQPPVKEKKEVLDLITQEPQKDVIDLITQEPSKNPPSETTEQLSVAKIQIQSPQKKPPPSGYMLFCRSMRHIVTTENPTAKMGQVAKLLGQRWKGLSEQERQDYNDHWKRLKKAWNASHQSDTASPASVAGEDLEPEFEEPPPEIKAKIPKKPGLSGYHIWANETRTLVMQEMRGVGVGGISKELSKRWKTVLEEERAKYKQLHAKSKSDYELFWQENPELQKYKPRKKKKAAGVMDPTKLQFPFKRIQMLIKSDSDVKKVSKQSVLAIGKAMELFLMKHAKEAIYCAKKEGRKGIHEKDVATAVYRSEEMDFLRATFDLPTSSVKRPASAKKSSNTKSRKKQKKLDFEHRTIESFFKKRTVET